jgi:hypothetical protein
MCFMISARVPRTKAFERARLDGVVPNTDGTLAWAISKDRWKTLILVAPKQYCTCCLAHWSAGEHPPVWPLDPMWAPLITKAVEHLHAVVGGGETLWATWCGDVPPNIRPISLDDLLTEIDAHRLANRTQFLIKDNP